MVAPRIALERRKGDASGFIAIVESLATGIALNYSPKALLVIRIQSCFGAKWLRFSGTVFPQLSTWAENLTVPPFLPMRVIEQRRYTAPDYAEDAPGQPLHAEIEGRRAIERKLAIIAPETAVVWLSGASDPERRGSLMAYIPAVGDYSCFYCGFGGEQVRDLRQIRGVSLNEFQSIVQKGAPL